MLLLGEGDCVLLLSPPLRAGFPRWCTREEVQNMPVFYTNCSQSKILVGNLWFADHCTLFVAIARNGRGNKSSLQCPGLRWTHTMLLFLSNEQKILDRTQGRK